MPFALFISMPELPPQLPSWSGALGFPRACSGLTHFSSLFCCSMVYPWEFAGSVPSGVLFEVQGLGVAFWRRSRGAVGTALLLGRSHCSYVSHSSPAHCRPPGGSALCTDATSACSPSVVSHRMHDEVHVQQVIPAPLSRLLPTPNPADHLWHPWVTCGSPNLPGY